MKKVSRRNWLKTSAGVAASAAALSLPSILNASPLRESSLSGKKSKKRKALIIGAHPDDPETIAGGTMILLLKAGWDVVCVYLTRGEAGIKGISGEEAAAIREKECKAACKVTG